jgi:hypothetical protein
MAKRRRLRRRLPRRVVVPAVAGMALLLVVVVAALAMTRGNQAASKTSARSPAALSSAIGSAQSITRSPSPSPSPSPKKKKASALATLSFGCGPNPHRCGFPDATNTGPRVSLRAVPAGARGSGWSSDSQGNVEVYGDGAVFSGYSVHGYIDVTGNNAVVTDDAISNFGNDINGDGVNLTGNPSNVTIEHVSISSPYGTQGNMGIFAGIKDITGTAEGTRVLDNNIADASTGVQLYIGLIEGNYIHDVTFADPSSHLNGTTSNGSTTPLTIDHNTVFNPNGQTDAISLFEDFGVEANVVINDNLVAGGGYTIYGGQNPGGPQAYNIKITNNHFSNIYFPQSGSFGYITAFDLNAPGNVWSGNVWDSTGKTVSP